MSYQFINSFQTLGEEFYSPTSVQPLQSSSLAIVNKSLATELGFDFSDADFLKYFSGAKKLKGAKTISTAYAGHQFGSFVPSLGDGRAHLLGEVKTKSNQTFEIQLKGSGKTPYSRFGDGKAVLRSSIREFLASEALHALNIPTTRALCLISSDENVQREGLEKGAVVARVSPSFVRFGHFEYLTHTLQRPDLTQKLADYVIEKFFKNLVGFENKYEKFFFEVCKSTAFMVAKWQSVGFTHGVMNTDNMSILGLTIDYGPFGFMDNFSPNYVPNHSDHSGRYSFSAQPQISLWNLQALSYALAPILPLEKSFEILHLYKDMYFEEYASEMRLKFGLSKKLKTDQSFFEKALNLLSSHEIDYTIFFRQLCDFKISDFKINSSDEKHQAKNKNIKDLFPNPHFFNDFEKLYNKRLLHEEWPHHNRNNQLEVETARQESMKAVNPKYILRNYMAETAIHQAVTENDFSEVENLFQLLKSPFSEQPLFEKYSAHPPSWASEICLSCSS